MSNKPKTKNADTLWSPLVKIIAIVCALVLIAAITLAVVAKTGYFRRNTVVMEVGGEEISAIEFNYSFYTALNDFYANYYYYLSYIGFDTSVSLKSQTCYFDRSVSWYDYFVNQAKAQLEEVYLLSQKAEQEGFSMTEETKASMEDTIAEIEALAKEEDMSLDKYVASMYGKNMTMDDLRTFMERRFLASDFYTHYTDSLEYTDEEIETYFSENRKTLSFADYYAYKVKADDTSTKTVKEIADDIKAASTSVEAFLAAIEAIEGDTFLESSYLKEDVAYTAENKTSEWLFDEARNNGDVTVIEETSEKETTYTVVVFLSCEREEYKLASMRHILFQVEDKLDDKGNKVTGEDGKTVTNDAEQKAKAEQVLKQWQDGAKTEDSFAALVKDNTDDTASAEDGGLYEDFAKAYMVEDIDEWIWPAEGERNAGDCEIVKTDYGYHIVYFVGYGETKWKSDVLEALKAADYEEYLKGLKDASEIVFNEKGLSQVG